MTGRQGCGSWSGSTDSPTTTPGDTKPVGQGVWELLLTYGPGYRISYLQDGNSLVLLLCGGDKSTQQVDIDRAHELADEWHAAKEDDDGLQG